MSAFVSRHHQPISSEEQYLYDHLLSRIEVESAEQMIERFYALFIDGSRYPEADVLAALDAVTASKNAAEEFRYVLNRCCHILINRWQARSQSQTAIPRLIELFETEPGTSAAALRRPRAVRRLRELKQQFTQTEQYLTLRRLAQVVNQSIEASQKAGQSPLGTLIRRYPYLYEHCLLSEYSALEQQHTVRQLRATMQHQFEVDLSQYITYQFRHGQLNRESSSRNGGGLPQRGTSSPTSVARSPKPVSNPTLLDDHEVKQAVQHYMGRVEGDRSYRDLAYHFLAQSGHSQTFRAFKDDLYEYLTASVDAEYGRRQFYNQLHAQLSNLLPESNGKILNDLLLVRTCSQLLNFLVVESPKNPNHFVFIDLLNNLGPILTTGLLLKVVLLCRRVKPVLERRVSILFSHYESCSRDAVQWLINLLENLNVALSAHFGSLKLSLVR